MNRGAGYCWRARRVSVYHRRLEGASRRNQQQCLAVLGLMLDDLQASSLFPRKYRVQACLRPRDRFWDIPVPKIDSAFDNLIGAPAVLVTKHYATTSQARCCSVLGSQ
ncbi:hypothetical protein [Thiolapillus sp.]|uniref:hypothetical protein n=2 Tax=Thiolapillus sp. TaxID=2017437 RepID=UPI003AF598EF